MRKIGLQASRTRTADLITDLLDWMQTVQADFTNTFHDLSSPTRIADGIYREERFLASHARWQQRLADEGPLADSSVELMRTVNPSVIPATIAWRRPWRRPRTTTTRL